MHQKPYIIVGLDVENKTKALAIVDQLDPKKCRLKVGKEMFTRYGPDFIKALIAKGFDIFLDLKYHDIPNTVARACVAAAELGVWMVNVHAAGGAQMMQAAREALDSFPAKKPLLIGVTILTSLSQSDLEEIGFTGTVESNVLRLAKLCQHSGLDGVVCSAQEAALLRKEMNNDFCLVTPGIRPAGTDLGDQKRVMTPAQAIDLGANFLVIGRPVTQAENPGFIVDKIDQEISEKHM